ncbi:MAG: type I pantothenate kinase [Aerococcus sp.]|nr:type I pantothenate kinase [Aerococcus sp.]
MKETDSYYIVDRIEWNNYLKERRMEPEWHLTESQLQQLVSFNDYLTLTDAKEIYEPLARLLLLYRSHYFRRIQDRNHLLGIEGDFPPFIIGISGSVAVGKSTTARLLRNVLSQLLPNINVDLITTDGFLYPTAYLEAHEMLDRKGFPESYDMKRLRDFLLEVKNNHKNIKVPMYSHEQYDIVPDEYEILEDPQVLIIEGINALQMTTDANFFVGDFADVTIYVDTETENIERWFKKRSKILIDESADDPDNYYYEMGNMTSEAQDAYISEVWENINLPNLEQFILPTRNRAEILIHKQADHYVDSLWIKKY